MLQNFSATFNSRILFGVYLRVVRFRKVALLFFLPFINGVTPKVFGGKRYSPTVDKRDNLVDLATVFNFMIFL